jgi:hypothetical protein
MKLNKKLIEDLKNGNVILKNDGTLEELQTILRKAFPTDECSISGTRTYYKANSVDTNVWASYNNINEYNLVKSVKDFFINKYTIEEINTRSDILVYINSNEEFNELGEAGLRLTTSYFGQHYYKPYSKTYTKDSSINNIGTYAIDNINYIQLTIKNINMKTEENQKESFKGKAMWVSDVNDIDTAKKRIVFMIKNNLYIGWANVTTMEEAEKITSTVSWKYAWELEEKLLFPFNLNAKDAQKIINAACKSWQDRLARHWAVNIVQNKDNIIHEVEYEEMLAACTTEQKALFNEIFKNKV